MLISVETPMKKIFTLLLLLLLFSIGIGLKAQTTIVVNGSINRAVANQKVWISYFGTPSTCNIQDSTITDSLGLFSKTITIGSGCSYGDININILGAKNTHDTVLQTLHYDSTTTNPDTMYVGLNYYGNCTIKAGFQDSMLGTWGTNVNIGFLNTCTDFFNINKYLWDYGDSNTYDGNSGSHVYTTSGYKTACLIVWDTTGGCSDTFCKTIFVSPCRNFYGRPNFYNVSGNQYSFSLSASGNANKFYWDFGDGNSSTTRNLAHTYTHGGTYNVCTITQDTVYGCVDTTCKSLTFVAPCDTFQASFSDSSIGLYVGFASTSSSAANKFYWDFGDGNTANTRNTTHTYAQSGTYNACLIAKDTTKSCTDTFCVNITVVSPCDTFYAGFADSVGGFKTWFTNTTTPAGSLSCVWHFGDGNTSAAVNPTHIYASPGTYTVTLIATNTGTSCVDTAQHTVTIGAGCSGFAANYTSSLAGTSVAFTNASSSGANQFFWNFGDSTSSNAASPIHTFAAAGTYTVCFTARDTINGCADTVCKSISVNTCNTFSIDFTAPTAPSLTKSFVNTSSPAQVYVWNFGDGNTSINTNPTHTYGSMGTYTVCLLGKDTVYGCIDSVCKSVTATDCSLLIAGFADSTMFDTATFVNTTNTLVGTTNTYFWDFGDSDSSTATNPSHIYAAAGTYTVCLYVNSSSGCADTVCQAVTVTSHCYGYAANYSFSVSGNTVSFTNTSSAASNKNTWDLGNGNVFTSTSLTYVYPSPSSYPVCLYTHDTITGCKDTICQTVTIAPNCMGFQASFTYTLSCQDATFTNTSAAAANYFEWNFDDANTASSVNPTHTFLSPGTYNVCLTAVDTINGCSDTACQTITINNSLEGTVYRDGSNTADSGIVYLIQVTIDSVANDTVLTAIDSAYFGTATGGIYQFNTLPIGSYLVKAALLSGSAYYTNRIPTYYIQETRWDAATSITVNTACANTDIELITATNPGGSGFIGGYVSVGANKTGDPLEKIEVQLYTAADVPVAYTYTDVDGKYSFSNLAYGSYKVRVEILGKPCEEFFVTLDQNNATADKGNFAVNTKDIEVLKSTGIAKVAKAQVKIYPNPASSVINIMFDGQTTEDVAINITDITGKQVKTTVYSATSGSNSIALNVEGLQNGVYFINIQFANTSYVGRVAINK
jgi:PKD repeat protein